ncbi:hypothetical protein MA16_Dca004709 [Dendrobium catenatum]|uniref:SART-1 family protein DOT2 n=1 Tax=Dendrobium catenatum TaxID=906689 RepID=A0A2I0VNV3_9ASPA|nr:hypothetical protein MA16_Dca004709 [Dendrobium catenatum]
MQICLLPLRVLEKSLYLLFSLKKEEAVRSREQQGEEEIGGNQRVYDHEEMEIDIETEKSREMRKPDTKQGKKERREEKDYGGKDKERSKQREKEDISARNTDKHGSRERLGISRGKRKEDQEDYGKKMEELELDKEKVRDKIRERDYDQIMHREDRENERAKYKGKEHEKGKDIDHNKEKSIDRECELGRGHGKDRGREGKFKEKERDRDKDIGRSRERSIDREHDQSRDHLKDRSREGEKEKEVERDRGFHREREHKKERERLHDYHKDRGKNCESDKDKEHDKSKIRDRDHDKDIGKEFERDRVREKDRVRGKEKDKDRYRSKDREREKLKDREKEIVSDKLGERGKLEKDKAKKKNREMEVDMTVDHDRSKRRDEQRDVIIDKEVEVEENLLAKKMVEIHEIGDASNNISLDDPSVKAVGSQTSSELKERIKKLFYLFAPLDCFSINRGDLYCFKWRINTSFQFFSSKICELSPSRLLYFSLSLWWKQQRAAVSLGPDSKKQPVVDTANTVGRRGKEISGGGAAAGKQGAVAETRRVSAISLCCRGLRTASCGLPERWTAKYFAVEKFWTTIGRVPGLDSRCFSVLLEDFIIPDSFPTEIYRIAHGVISSNVDGEAILGKNRSFSLKVSSQPCKKIGMQSRIPFLWVLATEKGRKPQHLIWQRFLFQESNLERFLCCLLQVMRLGTCKEQFFVNLVYPKLSLPDICAVLPAALGFWLPDGWLLVNTPFPATLLECRRSFPDTAFNKIGKWVGVGGYDIRKVTIGGYGWAKPASAERGLKEERINGNSESVLPRKEFLEEDSGILMWVSRSRKLEEKRNAEKEKAIALSRMLDEQDKILEEAEDEEPDEDGCKDLAGVKVLHGLDKVMEGGAVVLTLKDQNILADGDINEEVDMLESVEIGEQKRRNEAYRAAKGKTGKYDDKFTEDQVSRKTILSQYDDPVDDEEVTLDESGRFTGEAEKQLAELRKRIEGNSLKKDYEDLSSSVKIQSDYFTIDEMLQFKKPKKKKSLRKKERLDLDALEAEARAAGLGLGDLGTRGDMKRLSTREEEEKSMAEARSNAYQAALAKAEEASKFLREGQSLTSKPTDNDNLVFGEDFEDLQKSLEQARKLALKKQDEVASSGPQAVALLATAHRELDVAQDSAGGDIQENKVVITEMEEFVLGLQINEETNNSESEDVFKDEEDVPMSIDQETKTEIGGWIEAKEIEMNELSISGENVNITPDEIIHETAVGKGLAGALKLLKDRGTLKDSIDWGGRNMDKKKSKLAGIYTNDGSKEIRIERTDEFGRIMTPKEAFRMLSHKFHGKGPGKTKIEKRMKQYLEDLKTKQMKASDTPLLAMEKMREAQARLKSPYLVLSGHVKPGQTSDPRSGFATVEKDNPGSLTPMLGDKKIPCQKVPVAFVPGEDWQLSGESSYSLTLSTYYSSCSTIITFLLLLSVGPLIFIEHGLGLGFNCRLDLRGRNFLE